jgi:hypothetical protein
MLNYLSMVVLIRGSYHHKTHFRRGGQTYLVISSSSLVSQTFESSAAFLFSRRSSEKCQQIGTCKSCVIL